MVIGTETIVSRQPQCDECDGVEFDIQRRDKTVRVVHVPAGRYFATEWEEKETYGGLTHPVIRCWRARCKGCGKEYTFSRPGRESSADKG